MPVQGGGFSAEELMCHGELCSSADLRLILARHKAVQMLKIKSPFGCDPWLPGRDRQTCCLATQHKFPEQVPSDTLVLTLLGAGIDKS